MPDSDSLWLINPVSLCYHLKESTLWRELRYPEKGSLEAIRHISCQGSQRQMPWMAGERHSGESGETIGPCADMPG